MEQEGVPAESLQEAGPVETPATVSVETPKEEPKWDQTRQQIDQLSANIRKMREDKETLLGAMESRDNQIDELRKEIRGLKEASTRLDPNTVDIPTLVQRLNDLEDARRRDAEQYAALSDKARRYEQTEAQRQQEQQRQETIDKVCKPLDAKYGAKYRNAAKQLADRWVDEYVEPRPQDALDARDLLDKAYAEVVRRERKPEPPKSPPQDSGAAGTSFTDELPAQGTLQEIRAAMSKKFKLSG